MRGPKFGDLGVFWGCFTPKFRGSGEVLWQHRVWVVVRTEEVLQVCGVLSSNIEHVVCGVITLALSEHDSKFLIIIIIYIYNRVIFLG